MQTDSISPLAIIAIFAGIIEASALASLPFLSENSQKIYTWFLVGFPFFLTMLFFLTLNFNYQSLYQPPQAESADRAPSSGTGVPAMPSPAATAAPQSMYIALSGLDTRRVIETHILRALVHPHVRSRSWILDNLDTGVRIHLSVDPLSVDQATSRS